MLKKDGTRVMEVEAEDNNPMISWLEKNGFRRVTNQKDISLYRKNI